jgi:hypothetical protein
MENAHGQYPPEIIEGMKRVDIALEATKDATLRRMALDPKFMADIIESDKRSRTTH